jgi:L-amino acid N-acyltransferase YncA
MIEIRDSRESDLDAITAIYADAVRTGVATFEEVAPSREEMAARRQALLAARFPYLVAADGERVLGYAYAGPYRTRSAYRFTVENSIYLAPESRRLGLGTRLLAELIERCTALGLRQMVAVITGSEEKRGALGPPAPAPRVRGDRDVARGRAEVRSLARDAVHAAGAGGRGKLDPVLIT